MALELKRVSVWILNPGGLKILYQLFELQILFPPKPVKFRGATLSPPPSNGVSNKYAAGLCCLKILRAENMHKCT